MSAVEIYYFSGTGNSQFVAKELQKRIAVATVIPIASLLKQDTIKTEAKAVGFVFPLHGMTVPIPVKLFLQKLDVRQASYLFAIATRGGTRCLAFNKINQLLRKNGKRLDAEFILTMISNDPKFAVYDVPTPETVSGVREKVGERLDAIAGLIQKQEKYQERDTEYIDFPYAKPVNYFMERVVLLGMLWADASNADQYFYSDAKCKGCGICEKVCPSGKIHLVDKKPAWQEKAKCFLCYSCLNCCPNQAVQIKSKIYMKSYTEKNGRYPHPFASLREIMEQKK